MATWQLGGLPSMVPQNDNAPRSSVPQPGDSTKTIDTKRRKMENQFNSLKAASGRAYDALRVISAVDRGTSSSSQTLPQSEQVSQPAASSNFSSLWGD